MIVYTGPIRVSTSGDESIPTILGKGTIYHSTTVIKGETKTEDREVKFYTVILNDSL